MRRIVFFCLFLATLTLGLTGSALAAADDDIPGIPFAIGGSITQTVNAGDANDVYAVTLTEGQEVHIRCDPGTSDKGSFRLLGPGAPSIGQSDGYMGMGYTLSGGSILRSWADFDYIPPRSGTYYMWVHWDQGTVNYSLSCIRTARAPLSLATDSDNVPGTSIGSGTVTGVVSTNVDDDDVYAVALQVGQQVTIRLTPLLPFTSGYALAYLSLLDPGTTSIANWYSHRIGDRQMAENNADPADRITAEIQYTPTQSGTHFIWVEDGGALYAKNFGYQLTVTGAGGGPPEPPGSFPDVPINHPYYAAITDLASREIILGKDGKFWPDDPVWRQQFAKMIVKTMGHEVPADIVCPFIDVDPTPNPVDPLYPAKYVAVCALHEITMGTQLVPPKFSPTGYITRWHVLSMVVRAVDEKYPGLLVAPPAGFGTWDPAGAPHPEHAANAARAEYNGLLAGIALDFLNPGASATRGEIAQVLYNVLGKIAGAPTP